MCECLYRRWVSKQNAYGNKINRVCGILRCPNPKTISPSFPYTTPTRDRDQQIKVTIYFCARNENEKQEKATCRKLRTVPILPYLVQNLFSIDNVARNWIIETQIQRSGTIVYFSLSRRLLSVFNICIYSLIILSVLQIWWIKMFLVSPLKSRTKNAK